jgi:hypothetical protein
MAVWIRIPDLASGGVRVPIIDFNADVSQVGNEAALFKVPSVE